MTEIKKGTKKAADLINEFLNTRKKSIYEAYTKPSKRKVNAWEMIKAECAGTEGYNKDLKVTAASSHFFSTMHSFTKEGKTFIVKNTYADTYITEF